MVILLSLLSSLVYSSGIKGKKCKLHKNPLESFQVSLYFLGASLLFVCFRRDTQQNLFTVLGAIYGLVLFVGINNCTTALQYFETERNVMYRERFAGMYSAFAYALAQVVTEIPYIFIQSAEFVIIIYPMIGFYASFSKVFWSLYAMFCNLLCFNYLAMFLISITPTFMVAAVLQAIFFVTFNLFAGFLIPKPVTSFEQVIIIIIIFDLYLF